MAKLTALKIVMAFSFDSQVLNRKFPKEFVEDMVKEKFYGATILFSTGVFEQKLERSAQLIVWYRQNWKEGGANKLRNFITGLKDCVRIGLKLGQKTVLIELHYLDVDGGSYMQLYEIENKKYTGGK